MVVTTTGLLPVLPPRAHDISWLAPRHQLVRWPASLPSCSSRYPVLLARRANGSRNEIRLWAEVNTRSSTRGENRGPGPLFRSVVCHRADRLPQRGCSIQTSSYNDGSPICQIRLFFLPYGAPLRRPGGRPQTPRPGLDTEMGAGRRGPSAGIARHPPRKNEAGSYLAQSGWRAGSYVARHARSSFCRWARVCWAMWGSYYVR